MATSPRRTPSGSSSGDPRPKRGARAQETDARPGPERAATRTTTERQSSPKRYWSRRVTETSHALELDEGVFSLASPKAIAASLKRSAERSRNRKSEPYRSAMSMLVFYVNRAGRHLSASRREVLEKAKDELRALYGRGGPGRSDGRRSRAANARATTTRAKGGRTTRATRAARTTRATRTARS